MVWKHHTDKAAELLLARGLLTAAALNEAKKLLYAFLHGDYIPKKPVGCRGVRDMVNLRPAPLGCGDRCANVVGDDLQSGPIYCGEPATVIADSKANDGAYYAMCPSHAPHLSVEEKQTVYFGDAGAGI